jgi:hypothetical protein
VPRWISISVALVAFVALASAGGYVLARWYEWDAVASFTGVSLKYSLYMVVGLCAYMAAVGTYHTILSIAGLDEEREEPKA